jgi:hypothetical protein
MDLRIKTLDRYIIRKFIGTFVVALLLIIVTVPTMWPESKLSVLSKASKNVMTWSLFALEEHPHKPINTLKLRKKVSILLIKVLLVI